MTPSPVTFRTRGAIGVIVIDNPPVNALSPAVIDGLIDAIAAFEARPELSALVLHCEGGTFMAGGDIAFFDVPDFSTRRFNDFLRRLEGGERPVVAALHGTVLGGGLELAMACHWRTAAPGTRVGLPEVKLGLIPGSLGTQRLPRLAGAELALDMILSGRMVAAPQALAAGIVDEVDERPPLEVALARAEALAARGGTPRRTSALTVDPASVPEGLFERAMADARARLQYPALEAIVESVQAAATLEFDQGDAVEARCFMRVLPTMASKSLRYRFYAERATTKVPGLARDTPVRALGRAGVLGAGTMGRGIALCLIGAGIETVLVDSDAAALARGLDAVRAQLDTAVAKGRLAPSGRDGQWARLHGTGNDAALAGCDLVIEAVFEDLALKRQVAQRLGRLCRPGAIIATNTSTLDVDAIAQATGRAADVLGLHFFSPAHVMRLLEVVRGERTAPEVLASALQLARRLGKLPVVSGVCRGFIGNRMAEPYLREAEFLLLEGATPQQIDRAIEGLGLAMGPCRMLDMAGIDVGARTLIEADKAGALPPDPAYRAVVRRLFELGRLGQKSGAGFYRYQGRDAQPDAEVPSLCEALAARHGIARRSDIADAEIVERLLYPLVSEGACILEEGIALRGSDIDMVWTTGYSFPDHQGGPMFWADERGLGHVVDRLDHYAAARGDAFGYWRVSPLLRRLAAEGGRLSRHSAGAPTA